MTNRKINKLKKSLNISWVLLFYHRRSTSVQKKNVGFRACPISKREVRKVKPGDAATSSGCISLVTKLGKHPFTSKLLVSDWKTITNQAQKMHIKHRYNNRTLTTADLFSVLTLRAGKNVSSPNSTTSIES